MIRPKKKVLLLVRGTFDSLIVLFLRDSDGPLLFLNEENLKFIILCHGE